MIDIPRGTAVAARIARIQKLLNKPKKTQKDAKQLIEKDLPWLLMGLTAHHTIFRKILLLGVGGSEPARMYDIHSINGKLMESALALFKPSKKELERQAAETEAEAAKLKAEEAEREAKMKKLEARLKRGKK
jgi:hypothetical protein